MKGYAIRWGFDIDGQKIFLKRQDAEKCLKDIIGERMAYDVEPSIVEVTINERYYRNIWYDEWGFSGIRKVE